MVKKSEKSTKLFVGKKERDYTVGFGKYKEKDLIWVAKNDLEYFKEIETSYFLKYDVVKKKYYNSLKKRFIQKNGLFSSIATQEKINEVIALMRKRHSISQIHNYLQTAYKYNSEAINNIMTDANALIRKEFELEKNYLLDIHLVRYEEIYEENNNPNLENVPSGYRKAVMCEKKLTAMETLFQKEKLLGVHTKKFKQQFSSLNKEVKTILDYDITVLNCSESVELLSLLNKSKITEQLVRPIIANDNPLDISRDIKQDSNLIEEAPIRKAKETDKVGGLEGLQVETTGKSLFEVQQSINKTLEDKVRELFEKKNKS